MKIAVDAMGGDYAPAEIVKGAVEGARRCGVGLLLVGPQPRIQKELAGCDSSGLEIEIVHTDEYLVEGEQAAYTLRKKRQASILLAVKLVQEGRAAAAIGAGHTGGVFAAAFQVLGTLEGIARPMVGSPISGFAPNTFIIDLGGNVDSRPDQLLDFGIVGAVYARKWMNIAEPTVALFSNGKEEGKGNDIVKQAYALFEKSGLNFIGNVEGNDVACGKANVVVCDGFVGNCVVKYSEGLGAMTAQWLERELRGRLPDCEIQEVLGNLLRATIPADTSGGGPLLGVNGLVLKAHGRSQAPEIALTVATAKRAAEMDMVGTFKEELAAARKKLAEKVST